jgi:hypothetical protein
MMTQILKAEAVLVEIVVLIALAMMTLIFVVEAGLEECDHSCRVGIPLEAVAAGWTAAAFAAGAVSGVAATKTGITGDLPEHSIDNEGKSPHLSV